MSADASVRIHATLVAIGREDGAELGALFLGPPGSGKSDLALRLIHDGALLVADDQVEVSFAHGGLWGAVPDKIAGLIEARGIGLLTVPALPRAKLVLAVDLGQTEPDRLPPFRSVTILGKVLPLVLGSQSAHFPSALLCYLQGERHG